MNILKWMWKILPIMLLAVNATACNDDDDSGKRERPLTFEVTFLSLVCNYTRPVVVNAPFTGKDYHLTVTASPEVTWKVETDGRLVTRFAYHFNRKFNNHENACTRKQTNHVVIDHAANYIFCLRPSYRHR